MNFFIVKSGEVEIVDYSGDERKTVTIHRQGEFTGDISHLTGLPAVVSAVARGDCEAYEITGDALRTVLASAPPLATSFSGVHPRGGSFCASPQLHRARVISFLRGPPSDYVTSYRKSILFTWVDVETDPNGQVAQAVQGDGERYAVVACGSMLLAQSSTAARRPDRDPSAAGGAGV
jgi:thioredoxin reductase (NADPH)